jgi:cytochrome c biogenesis protein CcmG, thiol:disulfide interchange protein DsbE
VKLRPVPILISVAGACLIGLLIYGVSHQSASRTLDTSVHEGRHPVAPDASRALPVLGGSGSGSLAQQRGKVVLLNFWASWCVPCEIEAPLLQRNEATLKEHDATVLGVTYLDASPDSEAFVRRYHLTYPNLRDNDNGDFAHSYGTDQLPESFLIDRQGHVVAVERGEIEQKFINEAIKLAETT